MISHYGGSQRISQILHANLETYRQCGAPKIPHIPMTKEEMAIICNLFCDELGIPDESVIFLDDDNSSQAPESVMRDAEERFQHFTTCQAALNSSHPLQVIAVCILQNDVSRKREIT